MNRGVIYNRDKKRRLNTFKNLTYGKITPTDIDAFIDFGNKIFIIIEAKGEAVPVPTGQRIALERMLIKMSCGDSSAMVVIADVVDGDIDDDVDLGLCSVREVWLCEDKTVKKHSVSESSVKSVIDDFVKYIEGRVR